jgi:hypothetical protein
MSTTARTRRGRVRNRRGPPARRTRGGRRSSRRRPTSRRCRDGREAAVHRRGRHPPAPPVLVGASGGERQAGRGQAGGGRGDSGGSRHRVGRSEPRPPGGHGHVRVRLVGHGRRTGRRGDSFGVRSETTDRSTAVVTGQRGDGRAGEPGQHREPTAPYTRRSADAAPSLVTMRRGGPRRSCRGTGPPAGHQAADELRHAGQRHRQRGPALVRGPCLAPGAPGTADGPPLPPAAAFSSALCCSTTGVAASARATPVGSEPFSTSA